MPGPAALIATLLPLASRFTGGLPLGDAFGSQVERGSGLGRALNLLGGPLLGGLIGRRSDRLSTLNPERISGNAFAQGCARHGVGSGVCPLSELQHWARLSQTRYPNAYAQVFAPLLRRERVDVGYLQTLAQAYLDKRRAAPGWQQAATRLGVGGAFSQAAQSRSYSRVYL